MDTELIIFLAVMLNLLLTIIVIAGLTSVDKTVTKARRHAKNVDKRTKGWELDQ